jgi:hypothetical protein
MDAPLGGRIPRRDDDPSVRKHILPESAIQYQLIAASLGHLGGGGQLVKEENAFSRGRKKLGRDPFSLVCGDPRQTSQVNRIELPRTDVKKVIVEIIRYLSDNLRFTDAVVIELS